MRAEARTVDWQGEVAVLSSALRRHPHDHSNAAVCGEAHKQLLMCGSIKRGGAD